MHLGRNRRWVPLWTGKKDIQTVHWDKPPQKNCLCGEVVVIRSWTVLAPDWLLTVNQILERREKGYIKARVTNRFA